MPPETSRRDRVAAALGSAFVGLLVGVLGTFKHQVGISAATGTGAPIGLALALAMAAALLIALRLSFPSRWVAGAAGAGLVLAVGVLALPGPGGSGVVLANAAGLAWLIGVPVIAVAAVAWPRRRAATADRQEPDGILLAGPPDAGPGGTLK